MAAPVGCRRHGAGKRLANAPHCRGDHARHRGLGQTGSHHRGRRLSCVNSSFPVSRAAQRRSHQRRSGRAPGSSRQRGIALLVAILLVAIGTIIASAMAYENAMTARRGAATMALDQTVLVGEAAEALAAWGLREVHRADSQHTYIGQGWDKPQGPFEVVPGVMLTAQLDDVSA